MNKQLKTPAISATFQCLGAAVDAIGTPRFPDILAELIRLNSPYDRLFISALFPDAPPCFLSSNLPGKRTADCLVQYLKVSFLLDPFYHMYSDGITEGVFRLSNCVPDDFFEGDYFRHYYQPIGLMDECAILIPSGNGACIFLSTGHCDPGLQPQNGDTDTLSQLYPTLKALCQRHWPAPSPGTNEGTGRVRAHLHRAFQNFGSEVLTRREHQVVHLILKGHSGKAVSERLGISLQTVKNHRKSIHVKLGIKTQGELFSIFLDAVTSAPVGSTNDPLLDYLVAS